VIEPRKFLAVLAVGLVALAACSKENYAARDVPAIQPTNNGVTLTLEPPLAKVGEIVRLKIDFDSSKEIAFGADTYLQKWSGDEWKSIFATYAKPGDESANAVMVKPVDDHDKTVYTQPTFQLFTIPDVAPGKYRIAKGFGGKAIDNPDAYASLRVVATGTIG
jgi:hypothetical protein